MKIKFNNIFHIAVLLLIITSCQDGFLDEKPTTFVNPDDFLTDLSAAETYLNGAYSATRDIVSSGSIDNSGVAIHWGETGTDELVFPPWAVDDRKELFLYQITPTSDVTFVVWRDLYKAVNAANSVINRVGAMSPDLISNADQDRIIAEAKFLRGMLYFTLVKIYENIPLIIKESNDLSNTSVKQVSPQKVYEQIIKDLEEAAEVLEEKQGGGHATKGAAQALLGKVYLQMTGFPLNQTQQFAKAAAEFEKVINSDLYDLLPDYTDVFDLEHEQSEEMVFSFGMEGPGLESGGRLGSFYGPVGSVSQGGGWGTCNINQEFEASYDRDDVRLRNNIAKHNSNLHTPEEGLTDSATWSNSGSSWRGWKWHADKPNSYTDDTPFDNPYIRYADVLLSYAEAKNGDNLLTQAILDSTVNKVRTRARGTATAVPDIIFTNRSEMADVILQERRLELCLEGHRKDDLIRFGKLKEVVQAINENNPNSAGNPGSNYEDHEIRWPIPERERALNKALNQNAGYDE